MTDPREAKLPKWAQELLEQERLRNALRWPDEPRPDADIIIDANGGSSTVLHFRDLAGETQVFGFSAANGSPRLFRNYVFSGYLHSTDIRHENAAGFGSRGSGEYFLNVADARLALRWALAERAARMLLSAQTIGVRT